MTSSVPNYYLMMSLSQISSWHGVRKDPTSIATVRYAANKTGPIQSFSAVELRNFTFPNDIPNIMDWSSHNSLKNDVFTWTDSGGTGFTGSVVIPQAAYDGCTLATELQTLMNAAYGTAVYTVIYDPIGGVFQFTTTSGGNMSVTPGSTWPWLETGFCLNETATGTGGVLTSTAVAQLQGTSHLFISIPEIQNANSLLYNSASITFAIPVTVPSLYVNQWSYLYSASNKLYTSPKELTLSGYTITIWFERAGVLYEYIGDCNSSYTLNLAYYSLHL